MKNRTIYDVLNETMENYSYSIKKDGNKVEIKGSVTVPRIEIEVTHEKIFYYAQEDRELLGDGGNAKLAKVIVAFKEELKDKVASVIKEHKEELTDDDLLIRSLTQEVKALQCNLKDTEAELKKAREEITRLELEKIGTQPLPSQPNPWIYPNPWSTGITWDTPYVGDRPGWLDNTITCEKADGYTTDNTIDITVNTDEGPVEIPCRKFKYNRKNGGER